MLAYTHIEDTQRLFETWKGEGKSHMGQLLCKAWADIAMSWVREPSRKLHCCFQATLGKHPVGHMAGADGVFIASDSQVMRLHSRLQQRVGAAVRAQPLPQHITHFLPSCLAQGKNWHRWLHNPSRQKLLVMNLNMLCCCSQSANPTGSRGGKCLF